MQYKKCNKICKKSIPFPKLITDKIRDETKRKHQKKTEIKMATCEIIPNAVIENSGNSNFKVILNLKEKLSVYILYSTLHTREFSSE